MKKYLIYLVIFFSLFICTNKIKAQIVLDDQTYYKDNSYEYKRKIEVNDNSIVYDVYYRLKNTNNDFSHNIITLNISTINKKIVISNYRGNTDNGIALAILIVPNNVNVYFRDNGYISPVNSTYKTYLTYGYDNRFVAGQYDICYSSYLLNGVYGSRGLFYLSNIDIYDQSNNLKYPENFNSLTIKTFSNTINCENISKIKVNFDIPINQSFPIDLDFLLQYYQDTIPQPVITLTDTLDNTNVNLAEQIFNKTEIGSPSLQYIYSGTYAADIEPVNSMSIVIDVTEYNNEIYLLFSSQYNYSIEYITISQVESYFETINMNDKYAIYLIPKTLNQDISEAIYLNGTYNIEIRKFYNSNTNEYTILNSYSNYKEKYLDKIYSITDLNYLIYIQNPNQYTENQNSYIKFDTRYYTYQIKENEYTQIEIVNPNTNETIKPNPIDTIENSDTNKKNFLSDILDKFRNSSHLKNLLNNEFVVLIGSKLGSYIMLLFTISIVAIYIRMIKK